MGGRIRLIAATAAVAACSFAATALRAPTPVMATFAFALLASLGYVGLVVILRGRAPTLESISVAAGLVLAVPVIGGVVLQAAGIPLHPIAWSSLLAGLVLAGDAFLVFRHRRQLATQPGHGASPRPGEAARLRISRWQAGACALAVVIAGGAVLLAQAGAASQQQPGYTELWLTSQGQSTAKYNLGISNQEDKTEQYELVLLRNGHVSTTWKLSLATGQTWERAVQIVGPTRANLYLLPDLKQPYRFVDTKP